MPAVAAFTASIICSKIPGLTPAQQRMCQERPDLIVAVGDGARMGIAECQKQFRQKRWNCTAIGSSYVFGHVVVVGKYVKYLKVFWRKSGIMGARWNKIRGGGGQDFGTDVTVVRCLSEFFKLKNIDIK